MNSYLLAILIAVIFSYSGAHASTPRVDLSEVLFGFIGPTPHKREKLSQIMNLFQQVLKVQQRKDFPDFVHRLDPLKYGYRFHMGDPTARTLIFSTLQQLLIEPYSIEIPGPATFFDGIEGQAELHYTLADAVGLLPSVLPLGQHSGGLHVHVGSFDLRRNPFFTHDNLLRNMMVYFQKHPSILYGFAEAFDMDAGSSNSSYLDTWSQRRFGQAIALFDSWITSTRLNPSDRGRGLTTFIELLKLVSEENIGFFHHNRFINLKHLHRTVKIVLKEADSPFKSVAATQAISGKATVEFRMFRPVPSPAHLVSVARLLVALMERLSEPKYLEPLEWITAEEAQNFFTGSKIEEDWKIVKREITIRDPLLDEMIRETMDYLHAKSTHLPAIDGAEIFPALSNERREGTGFEIRLPALPSDPDFRYISIQHQSIALRKVRLGRPYWVGYLDAESLHLDPEKLAQGVLVEKVHKITERLLKCSPLLEDYLLGPKSSRKQQKGPSRMPPDADPMGILDE